MAFAWPLAGAQSWALLLDKGLICTALPVAVWAYVAVRGWSHTVGVFACACVFFTLPCAFAPQVLHHAYFTAAAIEKIAAFTAWARVFR